MLKMTLTTQQAGSARGLFVMLFWLHNIVFGGMSAIVAASLVTTGRAEGALASVVILLVWIGGSITFGIAAVMHGQTDIHGRTEKTET